MFTICNRCAGYAGGLPASVAAFGRALLGVLMLGLVQMPPLSQGHAQVAGSFDTTPFPGFASGNGFIANLAIGTQNDDRANPSFDGPSTLNSGNGAFFIPTFDAGGWQRATAVAIRASGRILIVGTCRSPSTNQDFCAAQLNSSGTLDSTFDGASGGNGKVKLGVGPFDPSSASAVALQADDKAVLVGECFVTTCAARIQANGVLDASFGAAVGNFSAGVRRFANSLGALSVAVQPDGKILIVESPGNGKFRALFRLIRHWIRFSMV